MNLTQILLAQLVPFRPEDILACIGPQGTGRTRRCACGNERTHRRWRYWLVPESGCLDHNPDICIPISCVLDSLCCFSLRPLLVKPERFTIWRLLSTPANVKLYEFPGLHD